MTRIYLMYKMNITAADDLATKGASASAAMIFDFFTLSKHV